jgi:cobalt/nickel transport system permease protein
MHHSHIDRFAHGHSPMHSLDARAKLLAALAYVVVLVSFGRYAVLELAPMAIAPLAMLWIGGIPTGFVARRIAILSPFVLMLCILAPLYDHTPVTLAAGPWQAVLRGGWLTAADVAIKFALGIAAMTALTCTTPFSLLMEAMRRLGAPRMLVMQIGFVYRYIFVLADEAMRIRRARDFRGAAMATASRRLAAVGGIVGGLLVRTLDRGERIDLAMRARGFSGDFHSLHRLAWTPRDTAMLLVMLAYLSGCRAYGALL